MKKELFAALGVLVLFGSGCVASRLVEKTPEQREAASSVRTRVIPEADFLNNIMKNGDPWLRYEDRKTGTSFQYPRGFFTRAQKYGDQGSGIDYRIDTKPVTPEDGICDGLGDIDCDIAVWPKRHANFKAALQGSKYIHAEYEMIPVAQQVRTINGMKFIMSVDQGVNGSCTISYVQATLLSYALFSLNICDDPQLNVEKWFGNIVTEEERAKANNILIGKNISDSTKIKIQVMEQVLATLRLK